MFSDCKFSGVFFLVAALVLVVGLTSGPAVAAVAWVGVPANPDDILDFQDPANWDPEEHEPESFYGPELAPPGFDSVFFLEDVGVTVKLDVDRTGANALGALAVGGRDDVAATNEVTTLIISSNVLLTGLERTATGDYNSALRNIRVGRDDGRRNPDFGGGPVADSLFPWGIVQQTAGTVTFGHATTEVTEGPTPITPSTANANRGDLILSGDKNYSAGGIWEVGGTASLNVNSEIRLGDRDSLVSTPGAIFRVRGSSVGSVQVGQAFRVSGESGHWDADRPAEFGNRLRFNRGKAVSEFVLDEGGVTPIDIVENLDIGDNNFVPAGPLVAQNELSYGFLRIKLSCPPTANTPGSPGQDPLVLFRADRISTSADIVTSTDYDNGRFVDPDHESDVGPHQILFDSENDIDPTPTIYRVRSDYAGAQYSWRIDYVNSLNDDVIEDVVLLSEMQMTGVLGDLNGDLTLDEDDRTTLMSAIASPPVTHYDLIGAAQHLFDLNADDFIDALDLQVFNSKILAPTGVPGDYNDDGIVDAADYTAWRDRLGQNMALPNTDPADMDNMVTTAEYDFWVSRFGATSGSGSGSGSLGVGAVPEPSSVLLAAAAVCGLVGVRRRQRLAA
jgi:hypothetical protein